jgi:hypothetical protein
MTFEPRELAGMLASYILLTALPYSASCVAACALFAMFWLSVGLCRRGVLVELAHRLQAAA